MMLDQQWIEILLGRFCGKRDELFVLEYSKGNLLISHSFFFRTTHLQSLLSVVILDIGIFLVIQNLLKLWKETDDICFDSLFILNNSFDK
jgi:hypothetical protein